MKMKWFSTLAVLAVCAVGVAHAKEEPLVGSHEFIEVLDGSKGIEDSGGIDGSSIAGKKKGTRFSPRVKERVRQDNASRNEGVNRCENCDVETVPAQQHKKGVTPPTNETQVDHVIPKAKGGKGVPDNGQILCRECNLKKGDKEQ